MKEENSEKLFWSSPRRTHSLPPIIAAQTERDAARHLHLGLNLVF